MKKATAILSLGSNQGDRMHFLQNALMEIEEKMGSILSIASVYETAAWGFDAPPFLNTCISIETHLLPTDLLDQCIQIEENNGRIRNTSANYQSRTLDVDILFYDDEIIKKDGLSVPHPNLHERQFVLDPLVEIAPSKVHPVSNKTAIDLQKECKDSGESNPIEAFLVFPSIHALKNYNHIVVEGNIGSGKTTLSEMLADDLNAKLILERFADNPFLPKFYKNPERYSFPLEMSFLADRFQQFSEHLAQLDLFHNGFVADYHISKSLIFAKSTLADEEFQLYRTLFTIMTKDLKAPDLYVYLMQSPDQLLRNIKKRGRSYEKDIQELYLRKIHEGYMEYLKVHSDWKVIKVDCSDLDFVEHSEDYHRLLRRIVNQLKAF
ncbi:MAG: 2-amino-4-hydroxy-6-hydroxymethyldihydropteridine diphosphokinase [Flavobacteriaceae bacterium]|nr:2-amino-4-hydroxy-6-hydroxymethyldihydropteridine diphosphokinase [Flavobacteriaceae bacterium]MDG2314272.1 2-amino-4-hydroxy-6-hydroxymethyldihydropteridine diphosphokinase [Flavobacteriaceae bacterium]